MARPDPLRRPVVWLRPDPISGFCDRIACHLRGMAGDWAYIAVPCEPDGFDCLRVPRAQIAAADEEDRP